MTTDFEKERNRRDQANFRARKAGLPEPYPKVDPEVAKERKTQHDRNLAWAQEQDATGKFYGDEIRTCAELLAIYEGRNVTDMEEEEPDTVEARKKKKAELKENRLNPSQYKLSIQAIELNGVPLEPNCAIQFRKVMEVDGVVSFQRWLDLRGKARKNLFWLGRLLGKGLFHGTHQYVCDQFVQKDFTGMYFPGMNIDDFHEAIGRQKRYTNDGVTLCRELILLESRGAYKSTINVIDSVQWLLNCPDIRIMYITAFRHLAKKCAREVKKYFYLEKRGNPTAFQLLFPEYVLFGRDGDNDAPLMCPASVFMQRDPNLWFTSMESSFTGDHCDIRKADDIVERKNSVDEVMRADLKVKFDSTRDVLDPWGFSDIAGTRYFTDDWYGTRALPNKETGEVAPYRLSCRGCWILSPEVEADYKSGRIKIKDILDLKCATLVFPYKLGWAKLREIYNEKNDEREFKNQQLNEATDAKDDSGYVNHFTLDALRAHCFPLTSAPKNGTLYIAWDWAFSEKKTSDFSAGVAALVYKNDKGYWSICVLEIDYDKWKSSDLCTHIIALYRKYHPERIIIENSNGAELLKSELKNNSIRYSTPEIMNPEVIYWKPVDLTKNAKRNRIKSLELLLFGDRLHFVNGIWLDETFNQLVKYTGERSTPYRKDDIPDAMSFLVDMLPLDAIPNSDVDPKEAERIAEQEYNKARARGFNNRMFSGTGYLPGGRTGKNDGRSLGSGSHTDPSWRSNLSKASDWQGRNFGQSPAPTSAPETPSDPIRDAFSKIFGGNGMRG